MNAAKTRNPALDVIRCFALACVVSIHFFLNTGFYDEIVTGTRMYTMIFLRTAFTVCVPLFLLLSGYLMQGKRPEWRYYRKLSRTLGIYLLASLCCIAFRMATQEYPLAEGLWGILNFTAAPYGWYLEMYIGLYLLTPFLNILWENLDKKQKQALLLTLLLLTALPGMVNTFRFQRSWWAVPGTDNHYHVLIPDWWEFLYPVTYFFLGSWLREYPLKLKALPTLGLLLAILLLSSGYNCWRSRGVSFVSGKWQDWGSLLTAVLSVLTFHLLCLPDYSRLGTGAKNLLARLSDWSLGAYLVSWIFEQLFYPILIARRSVMQMRLEFLPLFVPAILACSLTLSAALNGIQKRLSRRM